MQLGLRLLRMFALTKVAIAASIRLLISVFTQSCLRGNRNDGSRRAYAIMNGRFDPSQHYYLRGAWNNGLHCSSPLTS